MLQFWAVAVVSHPGAVVPDTPARGPQAHNCCLNSAHPAPGLCCAVLCRLWDIASRPPLRIQSVDMPDEESGTAGQAAGMPAHAAQRARAAVHGVHGLAHPAVKWQQGQWCASDNTGHQLPHSRRRCHAPACSCPPGGRAPHPGGGADPGHGLLLGVGRARRPCHRAGAAGRGRQPGEWQAGIQCCLWQGGQLDTRGWRGSDGRHLGAGPSVRMCQGWPPAQAGACGLVSGQALARCP
jgi:hypothetical protein